MDRALFGSRQCALAGVLCWIALDAQGQGVSQSTDLPLQPTRTVSFTTNEGTWLDLDVSPDGQTILFELLGDLYTLPISGGKATRITHGQAFDAQPRYSPDGQRIVFISDRNGGDNVWIANADGSNAKILTQGTTQRYQSPEWTPDGFIIVSRGTSVEGPFPSRNYAQPYYELKLLDPRGGTGLVLPIQGAKRVLGAAFGSDPRYLYAAANSAPFDTALRSTIVMFDRETAKTTVSVRGNWGGAVRPIVSPDNRWLIYGSRLEGGEGLRVRELATGREQWLLKDVQMDDQEGMASRDLMPGSAFTPDSKALVLYNKGRLWRVVVPSGATTPIPFTAEVEIPAGPLARFSYRVEDGPAAVKQIRGAKPSPDGKRLVFTALNKLWLMDLPEGQPRRLTNSVAGAEHHPTWSPDGRYVAYALWQDGADYGGDICRVAVQRNTPEKPQTLTRTRGYYHDPVYSFDGRRLAFVKENLRFPGEKAIAGEHDIVWIPAAGGEMTRITTTLGTAQVTEDNSRIWVSTPGKLESMRWDGLDVRPVLNIPGGEQFLTEISIAPNGKQALVLTGPGLQAYIINLPQVADISVNLAHPASAPVPVRQITSVGAWFGGWAADGKSVYYSLGRSFFVDPISHQGQLQHIDVNLIAPTDRPQGSVLLRGGRLITMRGNEIIEDGEVLITGNRIIAVGARGTVAIPEGAKIFDVAGKTLLPGYIDPHGHEAEFDSGGIMQEQRHRLSIMLAYGVTTIRDPSTGMDVFGYADLIRTGAMTGTRLYATGPALNSNQNIFNLEAAANVVTRYGDFFGTRYIKQYGVGERQVRQWLVQAAANKQVTAVVEPYGDVKKTITEALDGYPEMAHGWHVYPFYNDIIQLMAQTGMAHVATLTSGNGAYGGAPYFFSNRDFRTDPKLRRFMPRRTIDRESLRRTEWYAENQYPTAQRARDIRKLIDAGVIVAIGAHGDFDGLGYHWELEMHAMGDIPPHQILMAATLNGAKTIGLEQDLGSLEPGKLADLQILDANPLENIRNTQAIRYVMQNGRLYEGDTLNEVWPRARKFAPLWWWQEEGIPAQEVAPLAAAAQVQHKTQ